ncbi:hypothetical protein, partial [Trichlorobacter lovleyi]|uniref:hypothetical protein n=1 Tax=Trichlorobacter lovleyi TaxID=313985 RepID=UPI0023F300EA
MTTPLCSQIQRWHAQLTPTMEILRRLAGSTEHQFLELGEKLQDFSLRSSLISTTARNLVELVAGQAGLATPLIAVLLVAGVVHAVRRGRRGD